VLDSVTRVQAGTTAIPQASTCLQTFSLCLQFPAYTQVSSLPFPTVLQSQKSPECLQGARQTRLPGGWWSQEQKVPVLRKCPGAAVLVKSQGGQPPSLTLGGTVSDRASLILSSASCLSSPMLPSQQWCLWIPPALSPCPDVL
jgi:hypothetical protein